MLPASSSSTLVWRVATASALLCMLAPVASLMSQSLCNLAVELARKIEQFVLAFLNTRVDAVDAPEAQPAMRRSRAHFMATSR